MRGYSAIMGKKKEQYSSSAHLHLITRKLLISIEERIERLNTIKDDDEIDQIKNTHELLFGNKTPIAGNLVILAELLEKLGGDLQNDAEFNAHDSGHKLSDADIALVEEFIKKMKAPTAQADVET
jgi:hypothetical protein